MLAAACNAKPAAAACEASVRAPALAVSEEEAQHSRMLRARHAALVVVDVGPRSRCCTDRRRFSFGTRLWCDVPAAASNAKPAAACEASARVPALAVSGKQAQHCSVLRLRTTPRWLRLA